MQRQTTGKKQYVEKVGELGVCFDQTRVGDCWKMETNQDGSGSDRVFFPPTQIPLYTIYPGELTRRYGKKRYHPSLILYVNVMKHH